MKKLKEKRKRFFERNFEDEFPENGVGRLSNRSFRMITMTVSEGSPIHSPRRVVPYFYRYLGSIVSKITRIVLKKMFSHTWLRQV